MLLGGRLFSLLRALIPLNVASSACPHVCRPRNIARLWGSAVLLRAVIAFDAVALLLLTNGVNTEARLRLDHQHGKSHP